jgi:hypothetical protein
MTAHEQVARHVAGLRPPSPIDGGTVGRYAEWAFIKATNCV